MDVNVKQCWIFIDIIVVKTGYYTMRGYQVHISCNFEISESMDIEER